jgi:hypothetical protein
MMGATLSGQSALQLLPPWLVYCLVMGMALGYLESYAPGVPVKRHALRTSAS